MRLYLSVFLCCVIYSCSKQTGSNPVPAYETVNGKILKSGSPVQLIGCNAFHTFGAGSRDMNGWGIDIAREFVGNVKEQPLTGSPVKDANNNYLHSLQAVADSNRINNRITVICPFGWDGTPGTLFTGTMPRKTAWWNNVKVALQQWATQFINQPDVWLEVWNEPYRYDRTDGYTDDTWMADMNELVTTIRSTGNNNIILVPCAEQGQDESVLNNKGFIFLNNKKNILFDVHAYEKWLLATPGEISSRLNFLKQNNLPLIFGETAPLNAGTLMNPQQFLDTLYTRGLSVCAWAWKYDANDKDALLTPAGDPNNNGNNNWGTLYKSFCARKRNP